MQMEMHRGKIWLYEIRGSTGAFMCKYVKIFIIKFYVYNVAVWNREKLRAIYPFI